MQRFEVFKFGGASIKDAGGIKNIVEIIRSHQQGQLLVVASAMSGVTDKLEAITKAYLNGEDTVAQEILDVVRHDHFLTAETLFEKPQQVLDKIANAFVEIEWILEEPAQDDPDYIYDQIVSIGELVSTIIIVEILKTGGLQVKWADARNFIKTDNNYRQANVDWEKTQLEIDRGLKSLMQNNIVVTQGFIASSSENFTTTLGRDGSDYSAAIFCACLDAVALTIWKDVPGVLNADPKWFDVTERISDLSYQDAIELSYYGATVIHPKTIKPLHNKNIPLFVKSFKQPNEPGTKIIGDNNPLPVPSFIFKVDQVLISIFPKDFSFIIEENLSEIFNIFHLHKVRVNTMLNSALSFSVSVDNQSNVDKLIESLSKSFKVKYNKGLELVTIRYYNQQTIDRVTINKDILLEVKSRHTCQMVMKEKV
ncbi:MAG: aspartate kinase [Flavobacterium sp.]|nr:MAG: aspartate kinase [Flavobacterium sp.]